MGVVVKSKQDLKDMSDTTSNSSISVVKANVIAKPEKSKGKGITNLEQLM